MNRETKLVWEVTPPGETLYDLDCSDSFKGIVAILIASGLPDGNYSIDLFDYTDDDPFMLTIQVHLVNKQVIVGWI